PFALLIAAHQAALATRRDPDRRYAERVRLIRYLLKHGLERKAVRKLWKLIHWLTRLPPELELRCRGEVDRLMQTESTMTIDEMKWPHEIAAEEIGHARGL